jgi:Holliday junction resolvasome RuvABC endonuclease subunit
MLISIDLGSANLSYSLIQKSSQPNKYDLIKVEYLKMTQPKIGDRLVQIYNTLEKEIVENKPSAIIFEDGVFRGANAPALNYVAGVFHLLAAKHNLPIYAPKPTEIKKLAAGSGKADKDDVEQAAREWLVNPPVTFLNNHCSDSVLIGIYAYLKWPKLE